MKVPRIFVSPQEMRPSGVVFSQKNTRYLKNVLRLNAGDLVSVFDGSNSYEILLKESSKQRICGEIIESAREASTRIYICLAFGCVRPGPVEEILRHGTELGVSLFVPVISGRANRKPHERKERWNTIVESASAQCGRIAVPTVEAPVSFDEFLQRDFTSDTSLLLSNGTHAEPFLKIFRQRAPDRVTILVGPEGGFDEDEESGALSAGFLPASLCRNILRTETAALVAVGAVVTWHNSFVQEKSYEVAQTETKAPVPEMDQFDKDVRLT